MDAAQRTSNECPFSVATHSPVATSQTLSVSSLDPDTMRRPSGDMATQLTYNEDRSPQKYYKMQTPCAALETSALPVGAVLLKISIQSKASRFGVCFF